MVTPRPPSDVSKLGASVPYEDLVPEEYFRNALDLNRFSNKVARELAESYNRIIIDACLLYTSPSPRD